MYFNKAIIFLRLAEPAVDTELWSVNGTGRFHHIPSSGVVDLQQLAAQPVDLNLVYALGKDGRLWQELGTRDQSQLVDRKLMTNLRARAYFAIDGQHVVLLDPDHKLWSEIMPPAR